jgi:hypothetical protein
MWAATPTILREDLRMRVALLGLSRKMPGKLFKSGHYLFPPHHFKFIIH